MKQSGKHASCGAICTVCHNLPVHLHYKVENVYIAGIIPGQCEPSSYHLNHVLCPLVDDLLQAWSPVFQLNHSAFHPFGCLVLCALIPLICNLLAAQKSAGFAGLGQVEGKFCSFCLQTAAGFSNIDPSSWRQWTWQEHLAIAKSWREAQTETICAQIYQKFGVRWSELLCLSYWEIPLDSQWLTPCTIYLLGTFNIIVATSLAWVLKPNWLQKPVCSCIHQMNNSMNLTLLSMQFRLAHRQVSCSFKGVIFYLLHM